MDQQSPSYLSPEEALSSIDDAENWRMSLYTAARSAYSGPQTFLSDIALDQFVPTELYGNYYGPTARWTFGNSDTDDETSTWYYAYRLISRANQIINSVSTIATTDEDDAAELQQIVGEAYLMRAIAYQRLAVYFCDRYDATTATTQKGLPLVTTVDETAKPARATLAATYELIQNDLDSARVRMNDDNYSASYVANAKVFQNRCMLTTPVIDLMEARVALTVGDYERAAAMAERIINNADYALYDNSEDLKNMFTYDDGSEILFQVYQSKDERGASWTDLYQLNTTYTNYYGVNIYDVKYIPTYEILMAYDDSDIRFDANFDYDYTLGESVITGQYLFCKYPGNPTLRSSKSDNYNTSKPFRAPEAYLIAAEAYYRLNRPADALASFNALHHTARSAEEVTSITDFPATLALEYELEYMGEGLAFSAFKRLKQGVVRGTQQQSLAESLSKAITVTADNKRWTWEIPQQDLFTNSNIEKNWATE